MVLKIERFQPEGMNIRMLGGNSLAHLTRARDCPPTPGGSQHIGIHPRILETTKGAIAVGMPVLDAVDVGSVLFVVERIFRSCDRRVNIAAPALPGDLVVFS